PRRRRPPTTSSGSAAPRPPKRTSPRRPWPDDLTVGRRDERRPLTPAGVLPRAGWPSTDAQSDRMTVTSASREGRRPVLEQLHIGVAEGCDVVCEKQGSNCATYVWPRVCGLPSHLKIHVFRRLFHDRRIQEER